MKHYANGIWYDTADLPKKDPPKFNDFHTEGAETPFERSQLAKHGNFIKEVGTPDDFDEFKQGFVKDEEKHYER